MVIIASESENQTFKRDNENEFHNMRMVANEE